MQTTKSADLLFVNTYHMLLFISVVLTPMFVTRQNDRILQLSPMANFFIL
jgi:cell division protein FtsL